MQKRNPKVACLTRYAKCINIEKTSKLCSFLIQVLPFSVDVPLKRIKQLDKLSPCKGSKNTLRITYQDRNFLI